MGEGKPSLRWGVEQKLQFIEFRLFWEGHVNRSDLVEKFGVSVNQASGDLNRYIALAPDNMLYDKSGKTYVRSSSFEPLFLKPDATHYLSQVRSIAEGIVTQADAWIGNLPAYDASRSTPLPGTQLFVMDRHEELQLLEPMIRAKQELQLAILASEAAVEAILDAFESISEGTLGPGLVSLKETPRTGFAGAPDDEVMETLNSMFDALVKFRGLSPSEARERLGRTPPFDRHLNLVSALEVKETE